MLTTNIYVDLVALLYTYMLIYNLSLTVLFWAFFSTIVSELKTLYTLSNFSFNSYFLFLISILVLSMAGVPPFIGFFSKLFIFVLISNNSFFLFYSLFFVLLFLGLYFYVQNLRFLHSTNKNTLNYPFLRNERVSIYFFYTSIFILFIIILGVFLLNDIILYFSWVIN